ncbi:hypothetical protein GQ55_2G092000 [Panicum hallii var. hallii]|uniref:B12D protein n=3 Tax=Panicum sect. Panicum TaxID=2100772 RepID=A0A3L6QS52_PANMI|nr:uncharacterized protein LOC112880834 [Panicum hallii]PAN10495.1 hypothetical protein PAHAL_2G096800 [Panicum hallii]PUZ69236.1 hypothetical protein GQ55_2G092000 [Panicum hallii var. hallii]RLM86164.1 hypothetical protein C2845_PM04G07580 [Panicum miliaceum]
MSSSRWIKAEVYPLFATTGVAVGICVMQLVRNITTNPEVRVTKENRAAGVLDNHDEGRRYSQHGVRRFWLSQRRDYMHALDNVPAAESKTTTNK